MCTGGDEFVDCGPRVLRRDETLSDEYRIRTELGVGDEVAGISHTGLGDFHTSIGDEWSNPIELGSIHLKGAKVSSIDADDGRAGVNCAADLVCVMHLDQRSQPKAAGSLDQTHKSLLIQRRDYEEHHVCTRCLCLPQLVTRDNKILA